LPWTRNTVLVEESDEVAEALGRFGQVPRTVVRESGDIALDEVRVHLANVITLFVDPAGKLLSGRQKSLDTAGSIAFMVEGGREGIQVGSQWTAPQPGNYARPDKDVFKHRLLLFLKSDLEKEKDRMFRSCRGGWMKTRCPA
jgi:hypothetical protein